MIKFKLDIIKRDRGKGEIVCVLLMSTLYGDE
jgi:hypothetical protein